jgi:hypothetical protein
MRFGRESSRVIAGVKYGTLCNSGLTPGFGQQLVLVCKEEARMSTATQARPPDLVVKTIETRVKEADWTGVSTHLDACGWAIRQGYADADLVVYEIRADRWPSD